MDKKFTVDEYFKFPESNRPMELVYGYVREPPTPFSGHQSIVFRIGVLLDAHVRERGLGRLFISPLDVILDRELGLVVQPDVFFVSKERESIIREYIWGAPDLVVEVASLSTSYRDATLKLTWYRRYGVKECWFVHPMEQRIEVVDCASEQKESFTGSDLVRSRVLPELTLRAEECFKG
jgi:Uma2 family endonuclease